MSSVVELRVPLLIEQLRQQLADQAIEYIDTPDGHDDLPGIYAEMCATRGMLAVAEEADR